MGDSAASIQYDFVGLEFGRTIMKSLDNNGGTVFLLLLRLFDHSKHPGILRVVEINESPM